MGQLLSMAAEISVETEQPAGLALREIGGSCATRMPGSEVLRISAAPCAQPQIPEALLLL